MIGRIRGTLLNKRVPQMLVDVNGVGYEIEAPMSTFYMLPEVGDEVLLHTHLVVREDAQLLFGFASEAERGFFRDLIKVNGVGAKMGLAILSGISVDAFVRCVREGDVASLVHLPGVGKKTAERLIVEMKDKLDKLDAVALPQFPVAATSAVINDPISDAVSALVALGYKPNEASRMVRTLKCDDMASEEIIRQALKGAAG